MDIEQTIEKLPASTIKKLLHDPEQTAKAVKLVYVSDCDKGITRLKKGKSFVFVEGDEEIKDAEQLQRIKSLVLPPAWEKVWICRKHNGHLQATGFDVKNRKQYRYHPSWNALRSQTKFFRMIQFGNILPSVRVQLNKDLSLPGLPLNKVLAAIVSLMELTHIRIGNSIYEKLYGSFGLTTLKDKHVQINGANVEFSFKGKKGVSHKISLKSKRLANIVLRCRDIPGKELFQFLDAEGKHHSIDSGMVNDYIGQISGEYFTAKDFRTWAGTVHAFTALKEIGFEETATATKKNIVAALDSVAKHLGNTRTVCKKYYVHPSILTLYESKELEKYFNALEKEEAPDSHYDLTKEEKIILKILRKH
ncbi:MAG: DNA topoisomerase IB [Ferruginibacter sp.]